MDATASVRQILCIFRKKCNGDSGYDYTVIQGRKHEPYTKIPNSSRLEKAIKPKSKTSSMIIIFLDIKWIVHKDFILAGQAVNSTYYCDVLWQLLENVRRFRPELGGKRPGCFITTHRLTLLFPPGHF
jgi:hypothetical protein